MKKKILILFVILFLVSGCGKKGKVPKGYTEYVFEELHLYVPKDMEFTKVETEGYDYCLVGDLMIFVNRVTKAEVHAAGYTDEEFEATVFGGQELPELNGHHYALFEVEDSEQEYWDLYSLIVSTSDFYDLFFVYDKTDQERLEPVALDILERLTVK